MIVDHQWHWLPPELVDVLEARAKPPRAERSGDQLIVELGPGARIPVPPELAAGLDEHLRVAGEHGIDALVCSPVLPGQVFHLDPDEATELVARTNEAVARAQREHPDRFVGLAMLPLHDTPRALEVLEQAAASGLRGVSMLSSINGSPISTDRTAPVFERIEALGLPIVLHPAVRTNTSTQGLDVLSEVGLGWMYHTALAALNLITSGILDACPSLKVLHPHLGGVLPYVLGRLERMGEWGREGSLAGYMRANFYTDTVGATPRALQLAIDTYGLDRVSFATDYPYIPIAPGLEYVREQADEDQAQAIFGNVVPGLETPAG
jgi:aminocarboxymuconate-semialdehyde decarboxylase